MEILQKTVVLTHLLVKVKYSRSDMRITLVKSRHASGSPSSPAYL